jgi:hypothetical protein
VLLGWGLSRLRGMQGGFAAARDDTGAAHAEHDLRPVQGVEFGLCCCPDPASGGSFVWSQSPGAPPLGSTLTYMHIHDMRTCTVALPCRGKALLHNRVKAELSVYLVVGCLLPVAR